MYKKKREKTSKIEKKRVKIVKYAIFGHLIMSEKQKLSRILYT